MRKKIWGILFAFPLRKRKQNKSSRFSFVIISVRMVEVLQEQACTHLRNEKSAQRGSFWPDFPANIRPKTSVRVSKSWKNKQAFLAQTCRADVQGRPPKNFGLKNFGLIFRSLPSGSNPPQILGPKVRAE